MRRSEWQRRADDPKGLFGWWWRIVWGRRFTLFGLAPCTVSYFVALNGGGWIWLLLSVISLSVVTIWRGKHEVDELRETLPDPALKGQFTSYATYRRDGLITGVDFMAFTVVDGWLVGEGLRSTFALKPTDIEGFGVKSQKGCLIRLTDGSVIDTSAPFHAEWTMLGEWHAGQVPEGESILPPMRVHPMAMARWASWILFSSLIVPSALAAKFLSGSWESRIGVLTFALALFAAVMAWSGRNFLRLVQVDNRARRE
ncbi:hypothetical protein EON79_23825, partial [bacterium]